MNLLCHCKTELEEKIDERSGKYYECPKCHCKYKLCIIRMSNECAREDGQKPTLKQVISESRPKRKRGRPKREKTEED